MTEKYYTPTIDEFYVGFEYEYSYFVSSGVTEKWKDGRTFNNCWTDWVLSSDPTEMDYDGFVNSSPYSGHLEDTSSYRFRVKYLDREDIESLGWKKSENLEISNEFFINDPFSYLWINKDRSLEIQNEKAYFKGAIRNKSELIKLMKMLEI